VLRNSHLNCRRSCPYQISLRTDGRTTTKTIFFPKGERGGVEFALYVCFYCKFSCTNYLKSLKCGSLKFMTPTGTSRDPLAAVDVHIIVSPSSLTVCVRFSLTLLCHSCCLVKHFYLFTFFLLHHCCSFGFL